MNAGEDFPHWENDVGWPPASVLSVTWPPDSVKVLLARSVKSGPDFLCCPVGQRAMAVGENRSEPRAHVELLEWKRLLTRFQRRSYRADRVE
jgi:hypothetical protein